MIDQLKNALKSIKEYWRKLPNKRKFLFGGVVAGIVLVAAVSAVLLNQTGKAYEILYPGASAKESTEVYSALQEMGVAAEINAAGEVVVPAEQKDKLLFDLSGLGYPKSVPNYNMFTQNSGFTTTEFEKKQYLLMQLQDRIQSTLMQQDGVKNAIVTLNVPQESNYVWDDTEQKSTGSVSITLEPNYKMLPAKVSAIKKLVASSVPQMQPEDVTVVDASTMMELKSEEEQQSGGIYGELERLGFETELEEKMEKKVINILSNGYKPENIKVAAKVTLDYDKMITEQLDYVPGMDGNGVKSHFEVEFTGDPTLAANGIVGEENNTEIPVYADQAPPDNVVPVTDYTKSVDYLVSSIKKQVEKGGAQIKDATISVTLLDAGLTQQKEDNLKEAVSMAVNIPVDKISIMGLDPQLDLTLPTLAPDENKDPLAELTPVLLVSGAAALSLLLIVVLIVSAVGRRRKRKLEASLVAEQEQFAMSLQHDLEERRRAVKEASEASKVEENAITGDIREFAKSNPEITAAMIRAWLKEGDHDGN